MLAVQSVGLFSALERSFLHREPLLNSIAVVHVSADHVPLQALGQAKITCVILRAQSVRKKVVYDS